MSDEFTTREILYQWFLRAKDERNGKLSECIKDLERRIADTPDDSLPTSHALVEREIYVLRTRCDTLEYVLYALQDEVTKELLAALERIAVMEKKLKHGE